ncbi:MAG: M15 family metallopeptidase [Actinomycetota bacterium]|nr:M15 family metallopeptidase [Actinomycetota bacterium]
MRAIPDRQWQRMVRTGTWRSECPVERDELRRLEIDHIDFDGAVRRGVLVAHRDSVDDLASILSELFVEKFPIEQMTPSERFGGDVDKALAANNTAAFNCRKVGQINAPVKQSPHANGRAIDINPVQNPWRDPRCDCWNPVGDKSTRTKIGDGVIRSGTLPVRLFEARGWIWQNIDVADYMHFDTGYPSKPREN